MKPPYLYEAAIGPRAGFYASKFDAFDQGHYGLNGSWNWAAFFAAPFWCLYRKLYVCAAGSALLYVFAPFAFAEGPNQVFLGAVAISLQVAFATYANGLYHASVLRKIEKAKSLSPDPTVQTTYLRRLGGVHTSLPVISFIVVAWALGAGYWEHRPASLQSNPFGQFDKK